MGDWKNAEATRAAFTPDGWLRTGDVGVADADGFLRIVERVKDMIISGGENVYAAEVEVAILECDEITGVAVIGVPDARWGEVPHAFVTLAEGATLDVEQFVAYLSHSPLSTGGSARVVPLPRERDSAGQDPQRRGGATTPTDAATCSVRSSRQQYGCVAIDMR